MLKIRFRYKDAYTEGQWSYQECTCLTLDKCKEFYGLDVDCEYEIISIEEIK